MSRHLTRRRASAGVVVTAALSAALLSGGTTALASVADDTSTPVPIATPDGVVSSYVVNAKQATPGQTRRIEKAVEAAGGVVVQSWPQIGVVVAHAKIATFRADVSEEAGSALESVGATRTVPVSEGTPEGAQAPWGPGASGYKKDATKPANGDVGSEPTVAVADDPRETEQWDMQMIKADQAHDVTDGSRNVLVGVLDSGIEPRPPGPRREHRRRGLGELHRRRPARHVGHRLAAHHERPRHARGRHHRSRPQRRRHRGRRAERADGLGQGRQRRRVHLPGVRRLRLHLGRACTTWT